MGPLVRIYHRSTSFLSSDHGFIVETGGANCFVCLRNRLRQLLAKPRLLRWAAAPFACGIDKQFLAKPRFCYRILCWASSGNVINMVARSCQDVCPYLAESTFELSSSLSVRALFRRYKKLLSYARSLIDSGSGA